MEFEYKFQDDSVSGMRFTLPRSRKSDYSNNLLNSFNIYGALVLDENLKSGKIYEIF